MREGMQVLRLTQSLGWNERMRKTKSGNNTSPIVERKKTTHMKYVEFDIEDKSRFGRF